jgi:K+-transporting ATPase A subunit
VTVTGCISIIALVAVLSALTPLLGGYMARVGVPGRSDLRVGPVERGLRHSGHFWVDLTRSLLFVLLPIAVILEGKEQRFGAAGSALFVSAGSLGPRRVAPAGLGTLRTDTPTFVVLLVGFTLIFAVLTFLTVLFIARFAQALSSHLFP